MLTSKITKKGQITIPSKFRKKLKSNIVKITMVENKVIIEPVKDLGGVFQDYAVKDKPIEKVMNLEKEAFANAIQEKHNSHRC